jgi:hypothetical protein
VDLPPLVTHHVGESQKLAPLFGGAMGEGPRLPSPCRPPRAPGSGSTRQPGGRGSPRIRADTGTKFFGRVAHTQRRGRDTELGTPSRPATRTPPPVGSPRMPKSGAVPAGASWANRDVVKNPKGFHPQGPRDRGVGDFDPSPVRAPSVAPWAKPKRAKAAKHTARGARCSEHPAEAPQPAPASVYKKPTDSATSGWVPRGCRGGFEGEVPCAFGTSPRR